MKVKMKDTHFKNRTLCLILSDSSLISDIAFSTIFCWLELILFCSPTCETRLFHHLFDQFFETWTLKFSWILLNSSKVFLTSVISVSISQSFWSPAVLLERILCNMSPRSSQFFSNFFSMSCKMEKSSSFLSNFFSMFCKMEKSSSFL